MTIIVLCTGVAWLSSVRIVKTEVNSVVTDAIPIVNLYLTIYSADKVLYWG